jgi:hypothetical protein
MFDADAVCYDNEQNKNTNTIGKKDTIVIDCTCQCEVKLFQ